MGASSELFLQMRESEYQESEEYQLKKHLTLPAGNNQQVTKPKSNGKHRKS